MKKEMLKSEVFTQSAAPADRVLALRPLSVDVGFHSIRQPAKPTK